MAKIYRQTNSIKNYPLVWALVQRRDENIPKTIFWGPKRYQNGYLPEKFDTNHITFFLLLLWKKVKISTFRGVKLIRFVNLNYSKPQS